MSKLLPKLTQEELRERSQIGGRSRFHGSADPQAQKARRSLRRKRQAAAAGVVLDIAVARDAGDQSWADDVMSAPVPELRLCFLESVELVAFLLRASDRPDELVAALREHINTD